jgi:hypothetical protein
MNDLDDVWRCRTPKNSVVYGSGERRIRGQRRIALQNYFERDDVNKGKRAVKHLQGSGNVHDFVEFFVKWGIFSPGSAKRFWRVEWPGRVDISSELVDDTSKGGENGISDAWAEEATVGVQLVHSRYEMVTKLKELSWRRAQ